MGLAVALLLPLCIGGAVGALLLLRAGQREWRTSHSRPIVALFFLLSALCAALALWTAPFLWEVLHFRF